MKSWDEELPLFSKEWWRDTLRVVTVAGTLVMFTWSFWWPYALYIIKKLR